MRILVLGGTRFVGRSFIEAAVAAGAEITAVDRGVTGATPVGAREVRADRTSPEGVACIADLAKQADAVVDTWSGAPRVVSALTSIIGPQVQRYVYVSTRSVYDAPLQRGANETAPVVDADPDADATDYAADKRGAELAVLRDFGAERSVLLRAGLILGPYEDVGRLPWWLTRIARGGDVLAPGPAELPLQYLDARDLADFMLRCLDEQLGGAYNRPLQDTVRDTWEWVRSGGWSGPRPDRFLGLDPAKEQAALASIR